MLQEWQRKRWLVYHLVSLSVSATGAMSYSVGPGGNFDTGAGSVRPTRIESGFFRQLTPSAPNQIDYPMTPIQAREDYDKIALKSLSTFPEFVFLDTAWPLSQAYFWPIPQAGQYEMHISIMAQLPQSFATTSSVVNLPYEYYNAMMQNLALRLRPKYGLQTFQGDQLPGQAKDALNLIKTNSAQIATLSMPGNLAFDSYGYNIFSDQWSR